MQARNLQSNLNKGVVKITKKKTEKGGKKERDKHSWSGHWGER